MPDTTPGAQPGTALFTLLFFTFVCVWVGGGHFTLFFCEGSLLSFEKAVHRLATGRTVDTRPHVAWGAAHRRFRPRADLLARPVYHASPPARRTPSRRLCGFSPFSPRPRRFDRGGNGYPYSGRYHPLEIPGVSGEDPSRTRSTQMLPCFAHSDRRRVVMTGTPVREESNPAYLY